MKLFNRASSCVLFALPFVAFGLGARPLHELPGREIIGLVVFILALGCAWRLAGHALADSDSPSRTLAASGALLLAPWVLIALLWTGLGPPFQASTLENQHRYALLMVNALLVGAGFMTLHDALRDRGERFWSALGFAAAVPAGLLYLACIAITFAQATQVLGGDRTPVPPLFSHFYDVLEFFACCLTYVATALMSTAMAAAGLQRPLGARIVAGLCLLILVLLVLGGVEYPTISGQTAPWYTQPAVIVRIPAIPWVLPGLLGVVLLRSAGRRD